MTKVLVLGAGVIGVATAYILSEKGFDVTVLDKSATAGDGASFANGAQLSYSKTYPLSNPKTLRMIPKLIFAANSPIHVKTFSPEFISWGLQFLAQCTHKTAAKNAETVLKIALKSREVMHKLTQRYELNFDYARTGKMFMFTNKADFDSAKHLSDEYDHMGITQRVLTPAQAIALEPALENMRTKLAGVIYSEIDESGDAQKFCTELANLAAKNGAKFIYNHSIKNITRADGKIKNIDGFEADIFVDCLATASNSVLGKIAGKLPIYPMKGYSLTMPATALAPKISITDEARKIVYSKIGDRLRIAGVAEFSGYNLKINDKIISGMKAAANECFPNAADYNNVQSWAGLRPMTPSTVPIIERSKKISNLYYNTGHGMLGWTLALGSAEKLANIFEGNFS